MLCTPRTRRPIPNSILGRRVCKLTPFPFGCSPQILQEWLKAANWDASVIRPLGPQMWRILHSSPLMAHHCWYVNFHQREKNPNLLSLQAHDCPNSQNKRIMTRILSRVLGQHITAPSQQQLFIVSLHVATCSVFWCHAVQNSAAWMIRSPS